MSLKRYLVIFVMVICIWFAIAVTLNSGNFSIEEVKEIVLRCITFFTISGLIAAAIYEITDNCIRQKSNKNMFFNDSVKCVLLDGEWGIGKTHFYKHNIMPELDKSPIYISCFSATKDELTTRLIMSSAFYSALSLNGLLIKLMLNNWQSFTPKGKIIVFDDIERLHGSSSEPYEDIMAIIDHLKNYNSILLIANISEIKNGQPENIFNRYLEKIVDNTIIVPSYNYEDLFEGFLPKNKLYKDIIINAMVRAQKKLNCKNIRLLKNCCYHINSAFNELGSIIKLDLSEIEHLIIGRSIEPTLIKLIAMNYLFFKDNSLYHEAMRLIQARFNNEDDIDSLDDKLKYYSLKVEDFKLYNISNNHPIKSALSSLSIQRQFIYYSLGGYLQEEYSFENQCIINLYNGTTGVTWDKSRLSEINDKKISVLNSGLLQLFDMNFLQMDDRGDYLESELFVWGCITYNEQLEVSNKIAKCLAFYDESADWFSPTYHNHQNYIFDNLHKILDRYLIWFYTINDTLNDIKIKFQTLFDGFLNIYLSTMYEFFIYEIDVYNERGHFSPVYHKYMRNFFELIFNESENTVQIAFNFIRTKNINGELERYIIAHFKEQENQLSNYIHLIVYYFKFLRLSTSSINSEIREFISAKIEHDSKYIDLFNKRIKELFPNNSEEIDWLSLLYDDLPD